MTSSLLTQRYKFKTQIFWGYSLVLEKRPPTISLFGQHLALNAMKLDMDKAPMDVTENPAHFLLLVNILGKGGMMI